MCCVSIATGDNFLRMRNADTALPSDWVDWFNNRRLLELIGDSYRSLVNGTGVDRR